jgi:hypothetical protein
MLVVSVLDWRSSLSTTDTKPWMFQGSTWAPVRRVVDACGRPHPPGTFPPLRCGQTALTTRLPL